MFVVSQRNPSQACSFEVGRQAGLRTARRLNARQLSTLECPVIFEAPEAADRDFETAFVAYLQHRGH